MELSDKDKATIKTAIRNIDRIEPNHNKAFNEYDQAKIWGGLAIALSALGMVSVFIGKYDLHKAIGDIGVGLLPIIFIGSIIYIVSKKKVYYKSMHESMEAQKPLRKLGLGYDPYLSKTQIRVLSKDEKIDIASL